MKLQMIILGTSLVAAFAAGCGGNGVASDPLASTWSNESCFGASSKPADIESCSVALTFSDDLSIDLEARWLSLSATATNPGCTTTKRVTGQTWSTDHGANTFTVSGKGDATMERSDCVNDADNQAAATTTEIAIPTGDTSFEINADTLTISAGALAGKYTR
jgi:hypothetical protein